MNHRSVKHGAKQVAYDGVGNQAEVVWPAGTSGTGSYSVNYKYDAMNRMQYVNEGGTNNLLAQYSWDALSRSQSIAYGDGTSRVPHPFHSFIVERVGERRSRRSETGIGHCRIPGRPRSGFSDLE